MSASTPGIAPARSVYLLLLGAAIALPAVSVWLAVALAQARSVRSLVQLGVFVTAVGAAGANWAAAVRIAVVHRVNWPLVVATVTLVVGLVATVSRR